MELFSRSVAVLMLIILFPLVLCICIISLIFQGSPIIFRQERIGHNYTPFVLYKFRSMINNNYGKKITDLKDTRITLLGKILRASKLDEIPQLLNIVKGDMRFIGPRPEVKSFIRNNDFSFLTRIKPGLTDFSSILFRNESEILSRAGGLEKYPKLLELKIALGHLYAEHKGFWLDMKLVFLTVIAIIFPNIAILCINKLFINKYQPELISNINIWIK